jgi:hypothetical protein
LTGRFAFGRSERVRRPFERFRPRGATGYGGDRREISQQRRAPAEVNLALELL